MEHAAPERMSVAHIVLYFDTDDFIGVEEAKARIELSDEYLFGNFIMIYPEIDTIVT